MHGAADSTCKLDNIFGCDIGHRIFGFGPHKLIGVELWGIGWKSMHMEPLVLANELLDDEAPVNGAAVPQIKIVQIEGTEPAVGETDNRTSTSLSRVMRGRCNVTQ